MIEDLNSNYTINCLIKWGLKRKSNSPDVAPISSESKEIKIEPFTKGKFMSNYLHLKLKISLFDQRVKEIRQEHV